MNSKPELLLSTKRNNITDCEYYGSIYLSDKNKIIKHIGKNPEDIFFMRSLAKPLQACIISDYNIIQDLNLSEREIAIFCASHSGSPKHIEILKGLAKRLKINISDLILKPDTPLDTRSFKGKKTKFHNNCCGKHLMMLAMSKYLGYETKNYTSYDHPIQKLIYSKQTELSGYKSQYKTKDGCSTPLWGLSAKNIIEAYYNFFNNDKYKKIINSIIKYPEIYGGYDRLDSDIIKLSKGKLFSKVGAGGFILIYNFKEKKSLLIKLTQNNNSVRKLITMYALNKLDWLKTNIEELEYNQQNEITAKYCYEFQI